MKNIIKKVLITFLFTLPSISYARWATIDDAAYEIKSYNVVISVKKDGTSSRDIEMEKLIKNEDGREIASKEIIIYNENESNTKIKEATTIYHGKEYKVNKKDIEDKPLASSRQGFDQMRQILIAFPKVEIGSLLRLKYKRHNFATPTKDNFAANFEFGQDGYWHKATIKINSEIKLSFKENNPEGALEIKQSKVGDLYVYEVNLVKPVYKDVINEQKMVALDPKNITSIYFSSFDNWRSIATFLSPKYEEVLIAPLPDLYNAIVDNASKLSGFVEKANYITSQLNEKVHYHGDWQSIKGKIIPRALAEVVKTRYGDCKDFSSGTVAMLRKLGFKANVALVWRGNEKVYDAELLPTLFAFNHAIVRAEDESGKVYWIDPTNVISMAQGIFPDIADRKALVIRSALESGADLEMIPNISAEHNQFMVTHTVNLNDDMTANFSTSLGIKGEYAINFSGKELYTSRKAMADWIYLILNDANLDDSDKKEIKIPDLKSRIVDDISIYASYVRKNIISTTNLGKAFAFRSKWADEYLNIAAEQVGDLKLSAPPSTRSKTSLFKNIKAKNIDKLNAKISTPWLIAERRCQQLGSDIEVIENVKVLRDYIPSQELKSAEFLKLKMVLQREFKDAAVVFDY